MVEMAFVQSSNIESIGYDESNQELHVQFIHGGLYVYHQVPQFIFEELMNAPSKGSFFNREIKDVYSFSRN